jgi:hypothetical protein
MRAGANETLADHIECSSLRLPSGLAVPILGRDMKRGRTSGTSSPSLGRKSHVRSLLKKRDFEGVRSWARGNRTPFRTLTTLLFDSDELIRWRAIEALGAVAPLEAEHGIGRPRRHVQRLLWLMNDESGGICWHAPEAIGEILYSLPRLIPEFGSLLPTYFAAEPFERGSRWAVARLAGHDPDLFTDARQPLIESLRDSDPTIRGYTILALFAVEGEVALSLFEPLRDDTAVFRMYDYSIGQFQDLRVGDVAAKPILLSSGTL